MEVLIALKWDAKSDSLIEWTVRCGDNTTTLNSTEDLVSIITIIFSLFVYKAIFIKRYWLKRTSLQQILMKEIF